MPNMFFWARNCRFARIIRCEQAVILQGFSDVGILHEDFIIGEMLNELLSGMSSQLFEKIRDEKGWPTM